MLEVLTDRFGHAGVKGVGEEGIAATEAVGADTAFAVF